MEIHVRHQNTFSKNKILANEIPVQGVVPKNADTAPPQFGDISPKPKTNRLGPPNTGGPRYRQTLDRGAEGSSNFGKMDDPRFVNLVGAQIWCLV